ncbi:MAG: VanZ family protein [Muribaculaceae bacterium]
MNHLAHLIKAMPNWMISIIVAIIIAYISLADDPLSISRVHLFNGADKVIHFILYFALCWALIFDYAKSRLPHHTKINGELAFTCTSIVFGLLMEVFQGHFSQFRCFDIYDVLANTFGAIVALILIKTWAMHSFRKLMVPLYIKRKHRRHHTTTLQQQ